MQHLQELMQKRGKYIPDRTEFLVAALFFISLGNFARNQPYRVIPGQVQSAARWADRRTVSAKSHSPSFRYLRLLPLQLLHLQVQPLAAK